MTPNGPFKRLSEDEQQDNNRAARLQYDPDTVNESIRKWNSYSESEQQAIMDEGNQIYADMVTAIEGGKTANDPDVTAILDRWAAHLRYFYEPSLEMLRGLGMMYRDDPAFAEKFAAMHTGLPGFLYEAIDLYVDDLETAEIERMIAEDEAREQAASKRLSS
jgi:hypothetical protein